MMSAGTQASSLVSLLQQIAAGSESAWHELLDRQGRYLLSSCRRVCGPGDRADDALQETCLQIMAGAKTFTSVSGAHAEHAAHAWLHQVAFRVSCKLMRSEGRLRRREHEAMKHYENQQAAAQEPDAMLDDETRSQLRLAMQELSEQDRQPIVLAYFAGMNHQEMAAAMNCKPDASRSRLRRSLKKLRRQLLHKGLPFTLLAVTAKLEAVAAESHIDAALPESIYQLLSAQADLSSLTYSGPSIDACIHTGVTMSLLVKSTIAIALTTSCLGIVMARTPVSVDTNPTPPVSDPPVVDETVINMDDVVDLHFPITVTGQSGKPQRQLYRMRFRGKNLAAFAQQVLAHTGGSQLADDPTWAGQYVITCNSPIDRETFLSAMAKGWTLTKQGYRHDYTVEAK